MLTIEFDAITNMEDGEWPIINIWAFYITLPDKPEMTLGIEAYDAIADGYIEQRKIHFKASGCTAKYMENGEPLSDEEVLYLLDNSTVDIKVHFSGRFSIEGDPSDYYLIQPKILLSSIDDYAIDESSRPIGSMIVKIDSIEPI